MFYNGKEWVEYPLISADDEGFMRGYSVYEVIRTHSGIPFSFEKHYKRMKKSSDFLGMEIFPKEKLSEIIKQAIKIHSYEEYRFRVYLTPETSKNKTFYLFVEEIKENNEILENGVVINIARERKPHSPVIPYYVKTPLNGYTKYLNKKYDYYYDSLILNEFGYVTECTYSNIFIVNSGILITPSLNSGILPGVTRDNVIELARNLSIEVEERNIEVWELLSSEEVFLSHTSMGVVPVRRIYPDFTFAVPGLVTETLMGNWKDFIRENSGNWEED